MRIFSSMLLLMLMVFFVRFYGGCTSDGVGLLDCDHLKGGEGLSMTQAAPNSLWSRDYIGTESEKVHLKLPLGTVNGKIQPLLKSSS